MTITWSVDPAGMMGVLAQVDDEGNALERAANDFDELSSRGSADMSAVGRSVVSDAWAGFCSERTDVPRTLMWMVQHRCRQVSEAAVAVLAGDAEMDDDIASAETRAMREWGIASRYVYNADPVMEQ